MAMILTADNSASHIADGGPKTFTLYANDVPVGVGADNKRRTEVQLVQFFLRKFFQWHPELFRKLPAPRRSRGVVLIDGLCGAQTVEGIRQFQRYYKPDLIVDGRVSLIRNTSGEIGEGHRFTIYQLNRWYLVLHPAGRDWDGRLQEHPEIKGEAPELAEMIARLVAIQPE